MADKKKIEHPRVKHHYYSSMRSEGIDFMRFDNAYKGEKDDYTTKRIRFSTVVSYEAYDHTDFKDSSYYSKEIREDLGDTAYCINVRVSQGGFDENHRVYFWTKQQRDETLDQMDISAGVFELTAKPQIKVIDPRYDKIPEGSAQIQELPKI